MADRIVDDAVKKATGKSWAGWFAVLRIVAGAWSHEDIVAYLEDHHRLGPWWCQTVAVAL